MTHLKIEEAVDALDTVSVKEVLMGSDIQMWINVDEQTEETQVDMTFDIHKFREQLKKALTR